jgi:hypothetical protein
LKVEGCTDDGWLWWEPWYVRSIRSCVAKMMVICIGFLVVEKLWFDGWWVFGEKNVQQLAEEVVFARAA